jgi:hypothetical protein
MHEAMADRTPRKFAPPEGVRLVKIDRRTGDRVGEDVFGSNVIWEAFRVGDDVGELVGDAATGAGGGGFVPQIDDIGGTARQPDLAGASPFGGGGFVPQGPMQPPGQGQPPIGTVPAPNQQPVTRSTSTVPSGNEPLIRFDPNTGQMIVSQDPAIMVEPAPGVVYQPPAPRRFQTAPRSPEQQFGGQGIAPYEPPPIANAPPPPNFTPGQAPAPTGGNIQSGGGLY